MKKSQFLLLSKFCFLLFSVTVFSQEITYSGELNLRGLGSTGGELPFWMVHNQRGRISENTNLAGWASGKSVMETGKNSILEFGGGILFQDGISDEIFIDEAYVHFQKASFYISLGRKQQKEYYNGISASNENILWSVNARPLPGLQVGTAEPVFFRGSDGFGFEATWNEYLMGKDRFVQGARLHHKNLKFVYRTGRGFQVKAGLQHFAQWGGTSPRFGVLPDSFDDYLKVVTGQEGGEDATSGDQLNALGNHLGGFELYLSQNFRDFYLEVFYNHLFEDGSGRRLGNTPDGRYGIFMKTHERDYWVNSVMYELFYTHHQSHTTTGAHKFDNYFNNGVYRSGWTYENRILGAPFFSYDAEEGKVVNNKFLAHHIGIAGQFSTYFEEFPYKLLLSFARNDGTYAKRIRPNQNVFYGFYQHRLFNGFATVDLQLGAEYNSQASPIYGAGVHLVKRF